MKIVDGKLVLTTHDCWSCDQTGEEHETEYVACPKCNGTGKGPRGGRGGCKECLGMRRKHVRTGRMVPCSRCNGTTQEPDDYYDRIPEEMWRTFEFKVYDTQHTQTFYEAHIGAGCWSTTDYGDYRRGTVADLIEKVRGHSGGVQACKLVKDTGYRLYLDEDDPRRREADPTMPDHIGIFTNTQGYTVAAVHGDKINL